jgi:hypothetical protein
MPHVLLLGNVEMEEVFRRFKPVFVKTERGIVKATDSYIDRGGRCMLVDSLAIEGGEQARFMMEISQQEDGLLIGLWSGLEVEGTEGINIILAATSKQLMETFPDLAVGETDIQRYLD